MPPSVTTAEVPSALASIATALSPSRVTSSAESLSKPVPVNVNFAGSEIFTSVTYACSLSFLPYFLSVNAIN